MRDATIIGGVAICYNQSMKKILAVSGGIDSMALLEKFVKAEPENIVVAHFNHGTRKSADLDERFVFCRCQELGVPFETRKVLLGEGASEELARQKRYDFLYHVANKYDGEIYTAHHLDDLIESVTINLIRGTGWRGLTPFSDNRIHRPFIEMGFYKTDILRFAAKNKVLFREDPTNSTDDYLRNRVRSRLLGLPRLKKEKLIQFYKRQTAIRQEIEELCESIFSFTDLSAEAKTPEDCRLRKDFFLDQNKNYTDEVAQEVLRFACEKFGISLTRVQLKDFLRAIRTYGTNKKFNLPKDKMAVIGRDFIGF